MESPEVQKATQDRKTKKASKDPAALALGESVFDGAIVQQGEAKSFVVKVTFEGDAARMILKCESELRERLSKPDMGRILGTEILTWTDKRWSEIIEEHTDIEFFFAQIRKCPDKSKSIKLLKSLSEKLRSESPTPSLEGENTPGGLLVAASMHSSVTSSAPSDDTQQSHVS